MEIFLQKLGIALNYTQELFTVALILGRTMPMIVFTPFLGGKMMPTELKMGMGVLLTILVWPAAREAMTGPLPYTSWIFILLMLKEILIGFTVGFINAHMFWVMDMAGRLIDTARGTSMSEVQDPHSKQRVTPVGNAYVQLFIVIFIAVGGHHIFLETFFHSFKQLPINEGLPWGSGSLNEFFELVIRITGELWPIAVVLSAPVLAATFITDVVFGILNRVAPQLNAYFMSMPVKAFGGVAMIFVTFAALVSRFEDYVLWTVQHVQDTLAVMLFTG